MRRSSSAWCVGPTCHAFYSTRCCFSRESFQGTTCRPMCRLSPAPAGPSVSCPVLSCPVLSCPVLSCPVLSCPVLSCPVLSHSFLSPLTASAAHIASHHVSNHAICSRTCWHALSVRDDQSSKICIFSKQLGNATMSVFSRHRYMMQDYEKCAWKIHASCTLSLALLPALLLYIYLCISLPAARACMHARMQRMHTCTLACTHDCTSVLTRARAHTHTHTIFCE